MTGILRDLWKDWEYLAAYGEIEPYLKRVLPLVSRAQLMFLVPSMSETKRLESIFVVTETHIIDVCVLGEMDHINIILKPVFRVVHVRKKYDFYVIKFHPNDLDSFMMLFSGNEENSDKWCELVIKAFIQ